MGYTREARAAKAAMLQRQTETEVDAATVRMVRDPQTNPKPHAADVHLAEVDAWLAHGWRVAGDEDRKG